MKVLPISLKQKDKAYYLVAEKELMISNKLEALMLLFASFDAGYTPAAKALEVASALQDLPIPESDKTSRLDPGTEFRGFIDLFEKKLACEKTGQPSVFVCAGCKTHLFMVGKDFIVRNPLYTKKDAADAIVSLMKYSVIDEEQSRNLTKDLDELSFSGTIPAIAELERMLLGGYRVRITWLKEGES